MQYYRNFVPRFSAVAKPLRTKLLGAPSTWHKVDGKVPYTKEEVQSFEELKARLMSEPILGHPMWELPFQLHTDASMNGLGATLVQMQPFEDGKTREVVISYASRSLKDPETRYCIWELECLAIVWAMRLYRMYLMKKFKVLTDSTAAKAIMVTPQEDSGGRIIRWALAVQDFDFDIEHRKAAQNASADALSRLPNPSSTPYNEGETCVDPAPSFVADATEDGSDERDDDPEEGGDHISFFEGGDLQAHTVQDFVNAQNKDDSDGTRKLKLNAVGSRAETGTSRPYYYDADQRGLLRKVGPEGKRDLTFVPLGLRAFILHRYHGLPVSGHLGQRRVYHMIGAHYCWPGMRKTIRRWVAACLICKRRKTPRHGKAGVFAPISNATSPGMKIAVDITTASQMSSDGYKCILTILDLFTRYVIAVPLRRKNAKEVAEALFTHVFCRSGRPRLIISDQGREFVNKGLAALLEMYQIQFKPTGGYQPQANPVERYHRFLNHVMTMLSTTYGGDWPAYLPIACFVYNTSRNDTTGHTPFELTYAQENPGLLQEVMNTEQVGTAENMDPRYVALFHDQARLRLERVYKLVIEQQTKAHNRNADAVHRLRGTTRKDGLSPPLLTFEIGDYVLHWEPQQSERLRVDAEDELEEVFVKAPAKWTFKWTGPHRVTKKVPSSSGFTYWIWHETRAQTLRCHANKLHHYQPWSDTITSTSGAIEGRRPYKSGEWADTDALVVVPLGRPFPFGVAKVIRADAQGSLALQWYGNKNEDVRDTYLPGWKNGAARYYAAQPKRAKHEAYMTTDDEVSIHQRDVVLHSFELTPSGKLPQPILRAIAEHPYVWWRPKGTPDDPALDDLERRAD
jgi:hypothetical protein